MNLEEAKKSMIKQVAFTNMTFGKDSLTVTDLNYWTKLKNQLNLVKEEFEELKKAIEEKDIREIRDGSSDVYVTAFGLIHLLGINYDDFDKKLDIKHFSKDKYKLDLNNEGSWKNLLTECSFIEKSIQIINEAIIKKDSNLIVDEVRRLILINKEIAIFLGLNDEKDMLSVFESNLSKVSINMENAKATQVKYEKIGVPTYISECPTLTGYIVKVKETITGTDKKVYPKDKFLKCVVGFKEPQFD